MEHFGAPKVFFATDDSETKLGNHPPREKTGVLPCFAKQPHIDIRREALRGHQPCAEGRNRPVAHRNHRHNAQKRSSCAAVWRRDLCEALSFKIGQEFREIPDQAWNDRTSSPE